MNVRFEKQPCSMVSERSGTVLLKSWHILICVYLTINQIANCEEIVNKYEHPPIHVTH